MTINETLGTVSVDPATGQTIKEHPYLTVEELERLLTEHSAAARI
jgi:hypothetical protein